MTHPTDDELEAMAEMVEHCQLWPSDRERAAAMLRACKGRVQVKPLEWEGDDNHQRAVTPCGMTSYGIDVWKSNATGEITRVAMDGENYVSVRLAKSAAQADYERRILAALETAPDHSDWNAAIEAAAKVAGLTTAPFADTQNEAVGLQPVGQQIATAIRQLKKGTPQ